MFKVNTETEKQQTGGCGCGCRIQTKSNILRLELLTTKKEKKVKTNKKINK